MYCEDVKKTVVLREKDMINNKETIITGTKQLKETENEQLWVLIQM